MMYRQGFLDHHEPAQGQAAVADSGGAATITFGPVAQTYCWYVENIALTGVHANTTAAVYVSPGGVGAGALVDYRADITTSRISDRNQPIFVPGGYSLIIVFGAATSGDALTAAVQIAVHKISPVEYSVGEHVRAEINIEESAAERQQDEPHAHALPSPGLDRLDRKLV